MVFPYLTYDDMETVAQNLLLEYEHKGGQLTPPIPIEDIIGNHLELSLEIDNLKDELGLSDVLGGIYFLERRIVIDSSLEEKVGRFNFTAAHEVAHWELHRELFITNPNQTDLFSPNSDTTIICRDSKNKNREELQADFTAACILMPRNLLAQAIREYYGQEVYLFKPSTRFSRYDYCLNHVARNFNVTFGVSIQAMMIRLKQTQLVRDTTVDMIDRLNLYAN